jgi:hypothetical protein
MGWPLAVVLICSLSGFIIVGLSNVFFFAIVREVNSVSPEDQRIKPWIAGLRFYRIYRRHRELFPESRNRSRVGWLSALGSLLFFGALIGGILATNAGWIKN